ncbi:MAG: 5-oxoprolinase subunit PxpA [Streptosporangiales bacterium]|nr:5-oxoprolinase subunit PxpA [Streptosporangiales bacterium]
MRIDLNSDLGEGFGRWELGDDDALLSVVTSANVACGFHAGDPSVMRRTCEIAAERGVSIGAHTAYRDLAGFGRRFVDVPPKELTNDMLYQLGALRQFAEAAGTTVNYIKPHGALYNTIVHHEEQAKAVVEAVVKYDPTLVCLGLPGAAWLRYAEEAGLPTRHEAFADRAYNPDGTLVSRRQPGSVLHDPAEVTARCVRMATEGEIVAIDGSVIKANPDSICVHGDSPGAVDMAKAIRAGLDAAGATVEPFAMEPSAEHRA